MPHVITEPCIGVKDTACTEVCPVDAIHGTEESEQYFIKSSTSSTPTSASTAAPAPPCAPWKPSSRRRTSPRT